MYLFFNRFKGALALAMLPAFISLTGCASYYSHYAMFPAENSAGEPRQVRLSWDTADYPDWWFVDDKATAILVETQCSTRTWQLRDDADELAGACGNGIRACGRPGQDLLARNGTAAGASTRCLAINPGAQVSGIPDIGRQLQLLVSCKPATLTSGEGEDADNVDYIRASSVPYTVYARKAPRGAFRARLPVFDDSVCDQE